MVAGDVDLHPHRHGARYCFDFIIPSIFERVWMLVRYWGLMTWVGVYAGANEDVGKWWRWVYCV